MILQENNVGEETKLVIRIIRLALMHIHYWRKYLCLPCWLMVVCTNTFFLTFIHKLLWRKQEIITI